MSDVDMLESLALRLVQGMEELGVNWWCFNGWSFRKLSQEDLVLQNVRDDGSRRTHYEQEHEPGTRPAAEVEAGDDGREPGGRPVVRATKEARRRFAEAKLRRQAAKTTSGRRLAAGPRRRLSRRGWR